MILLEICGNTLGEFVKIVAIPANITVGCNNKATCSSGRVLNDLARLRLNQPHDAIDQRTGGEVLARPGFLLCSVLFQKAFIEISKSLFPRRKPIRSEE